MLISATFSSLSPPLPSRHSYPLLACHGMCAKNLPISSVCKTLRNLLVETWMLVDTPTLHYSQTVYPSGHKKMSFILADQQHPRIWAQMREGGRGLRGLSQWVQLCKWSPKKLCWSNSIFNHDGYTVYTASYQPIRNHKIILYSQ